MTDTTPKRTTDDLSEPTDELGLFATIKADLAATAKLKGRPFPTLGGYLDMLTLPGVCAVVVFRFAHYFHTHKLRPLSRACYFFNVVLFGADLAPGAKIGPGLQIAHPVFTGWGNQLVMGRNVLLSGGVRFATAARPDRQGHPVVGDDVFFLDMAKVLGGVKIGDGALIGANALVIDDVEPFTIVVGQPARFVRNRDEVERPEGLE